MAGSSRSLAMFGYVECGPCIGKKQKAVKSCLNCLDSYCPLHLDLHEELHAGKRHKVINATGFLQDKICSQHDKLLEVFCCSDQQCICLMCTMENHRGHEIVSAAAERTEKQAQSALAETDKIFNEMIRAIESRRSEVQDLIKAQEKLAVSRAEVFLKQLEEEIADLRKRDEELQQLSLTDDHIHFLQVRPLALQQSSNFRDLNLDTNTAYRRLALSNSNKTVANNDRDLTYPDHPERFDWPQVLCKEVVSDRAYWEVDWAGTNGVNIAVSYKSIPRKGGRNECWFGCSEQSWRLYCSPFRYAFRHHSKETYIPKTNQSSRIGVYVDYSAGTLSFYSIADKMILLYKVQAEFTEPLYAGFTVWPGSKLTLCPPAKV
ncbi:tripartite motif-containing protein 16-like [Astyanax mexicanus]|uniref:Tripartite motif-containing protein 16-like n=1 Tax=Astyanax mexicanus TaxID=7994 RepID=A0A8T2M9F0_ASTMX|nr:tripartite motif-containing protein 16-like [Astyanax mexicanus]